MANECFEYLEVFLFEKNSWRNFYLIRKNGAIISYHFNDEWLFAFDLFDNKINILYIIELNKKNSLFNFHVSFQRLVSYE